MLTERFQKRKTKWTKIMIKVSAVEGFVQLLLFVTGEHIIFELRVETIAPINHVRTIESIL